MIDSKETRLTLHPAGKAVAGPAPRLSLRARRQELMARVERERVELWHAVARLRRTTGARVTELRPSTWVRANLFTCVVGAFFVGYLVGRRGR